MSSNSPPIVEHQIRVSRPPIKSAVHDDRGENVVQMQAPIKATGWPIPQQKRNSPYGEPRASGRTYERHHLAPARILIALPATPVRVTTDMAACSCISILARRVSGRVSVGLNAKLVVKATNK